MYKTYSPQPMSQRKKLGLRISMSPIKHFSLTQLQLRSRSRPAYHAKTKAKTKPTCDVKSNIFRCRHNTESTRPRLERGASPLMMRRWTNQISQRSLHPLSFNATDSHKRIRHSGSPHIQAIRLIRPRSVTMTVDSAVFM